MNSRTNFRLALQRERSIIESKRSILDNKNTDKGENCKKMEKNWDFSNNSRSDDLHSKYTNAYDYYYNDEDATSHFATSSYKPTFYVTENYTSNDSSYQSSNNSSVQNSPDLRRKSLTTLGFESAAYSRSHSPAVNIPSIRSTPRLKQVQAESIAEDMGRKNLTLSNSLPPGLAAQNSPPKFADSDRLAMSAIRNYPDQQFHFNDIYSRQHQSIQFNNTTNGAVQHSPVEYSPRDYVDSPTSASYTSAQSEIDDVIIDEILSMEEEQKLRNRQHSGSSPNGQLEKSLVPNSFSYAENLQNLLSANNCGSRNSILNREYNNSKVAFNRQLSTSAPTSTFDIETLVKEEIFKEQDGMRDRRKKDVHNMIERRRRYNINDRIKELGSLLPKSCTEEMKLNKGSILRASVEYIRVMRKDQDYMAHVQQRQHILESENRKMIQRIQDLEQQLNKHGLPLPVTANFSLADMSPAKSTNTTVYLSRSIKSEAPEDVTEPPTPQAILLNGVHIAAHPLSPYHSWNAAAPQRSCHDYSQSSVGGTTTAHVYAGQAYFGGTTSAHDYYAAPSTTTHDVLLSSVCNNNYNGNQDISTLNIHGSHHQLILSTNGQHLHQQQQQYVNNRFGTQIQIQDEHDRCLQDLISDLNCENLTATAELLSSTHDPLISASDDSIDSRLIGHCSSSSAPSPDTAHWDSSSLSPDIPDKMDFVSV